MDGSTGTARNGRPRRDHATTTATSINAATRTYGVWDMCFALKLIFGGHDMDDIQFLREHASEESYLFLVDSASRDTAFFPDANTYEILFNSPFRNVVGLDLIDASLPRTEYLVESGTLVYTASDTYGQNPKQRTATLPPGDYNLPQLIEQLNTILSTTASKQNFSPVQVQALTSPAEVSNKLVFTSSKPFRIDVQASSLTKVLGLGLGTLQSNTGFVGDVVENVLNAPVPTDTTGIQLTSSSYTYLMPAVPYTGLPTTATVFVSSGTAMPIRVQLMTRDNVQLAYGSVTTTESEFQQLQTTLTWTSATTTFLDANTQYNVKFSLGSGSATILSVNNTPCFDFSMDVLLHTIECPNIVDLTGEPYVFIRCPEIEQHLYRDRTFERVHAGLGMVKLATNGFREQRYDFVSFPPRRLSTPMGKLSKLTFKIEKGDGTLYTTHGINHYLLLVVRYLEVTKKPHMAGSVINPGYTPSPLHYMIQNKNQIF